MNGAREHSAEQCCPTEIGGEPQTQAMGVTLNFLAATLQNTWKKRRKERGKISFNTMFSLTQRIKNTIMLVCNQYT